MQSALSSLDDLPQINLAAWKEKFFKLVEETPYRPKGGYAKPAPRDADLDAAATEERAAPSASHKDLLGQWQVFLQTLEETGQARLASHLRLCSLVSAETQTLKLKCASRVTYETLLDELHVVSESARAFYQTAVFFEISLDKAALSAAKEERSREARFKALSENSELVRYLISEFGAELSY